MRLQLNSRYGRAAGAVRFPSRSRKPGILSGFFVTCRLQPYIETTVPTPMKSLTLAFLTTFLISCGKRHHIFPKDVVAIRPVFKDSSFQHRQGYHVGKDVIVYDKMSENVEEFLARKLSEREMFPMDSTPNRIFKLIGGLESFKMIPLPIKTVPLSEFGYLELTNGKVVFYGIMGMDGFFDLTHRRGYHAPVRK